MPSINNMTNISWDCFRNMLESYAYLQGEFIRAVALDKEDTAQYFKQKANTYLIEAKKLFDLQQQPYLYFADKEGLWELPAVTQPGMKRPWAASSKTYKPWEMWTEDEGKKEEVIYYEDNGEREI